MTPADAAFQRGHAARLSGGCEGRRRHRDDAHQRQERLDLVRKVFAALPMIAAMNSAMAEATGLPGWRRLRPPLVGLSAEQENTLRTSMAQADFRIAFPRAA